MLVYKATIALKSASLPYVPIIAAVAKIFAAV